MCIFNWLLKERYIYSVGIICDIYYIQLGIIPTSILQIQTMRLREDKTFCPRSLAQYSAEVRYTLLQSSVSWKTT